MPERVLWRPPWKRRLLRPRAAMPTLRRARNHCPEEGLGGERYWVYYRGDNAGFIERTWDSRGVHWRAHFAGYLIAEPDEDRPRAFDTSSDALNAILEAHGLQGDLEYQGTWNPEDRAKRRPRRSA